MQYYLRRWPNIKSALYLRASVWSTSISGPTIQAKIFENYTATAPIYFVGKLISLKMSYYWSGTRSRPIGGLRYTSRQMEKTGQDRRVLTNNGLSSVNIGNLQCKAKRQYLLTLQVSRYYLLALQRRAVCSDNESTTLLPPSAHTQQQSPSSISLAGLLSLPPPPPPPPRPSSSVGRRTSTDPPMENLSNCVTTGK